MLLSECSKLRDKRWLQSGTHVCVSLVISASAAYLFVLQRRYKPSFSQTACVYIYVCLCVCPRICFCNTYIASPRIVSNLYCSSVTKRPTSIPTSNKQQLITFTSSFRFATISLKIYLITSWLLSFSTFSTLMHLCCINDDVGLDL